MRRGLAPVDTCALCGQVGADLKHRVLRCPAWRVERAKAFANSTWEWLQCQSEDFLDRLCMGRVRVTEVMRLPAWSLEFRTLGPTGKLTGSIYVDGSSSRPTDAEGRRAGWALIELRGDKVFRAVYGRVPLEDGPGQTAPEAEDYAISRLADFTEGNLE
eukprot:484435-Amphidinium_carterae.1